ncbi:hypothetical protein NL676_018979 [Syzygium grande]|nr:hypothetical protein NL676_018979 [Syzygium grande]
MKSRLPSKLRAAGELVGLDLEPGQTREGAKPSGIEPSSTLLSKQSSPKLEKEEIESGIELESELLDSSCPRNGLEVREVPGDGGKGARVAGLVEGEFGESARTRVVEGVAAEAAGELVAKDDVAEESDGRESNRGGRQGGGVH